ncbi:hypothetical protein [Ferruginibacter albus]|uniref:hypothetical protein n=1 Tax=Ferruginibacter albus TaxID=2875540 RepID=UPI001CC7CC12|nr:hypothetical protein [Ferruginibacter albus]UAY53250.1 hypothetical protein K9M53_06155 [Ferruginibacter albus]
MKIKNVIVLSFIFLTGCFESGTFYDLGNGFNFGYYNNTKKTSDIFYNDTGILNSICHLVKWNDNYILAQCYYHDKNIIRDTFYLINKQLYKDNPKQLQSDGILGPLSKDAILKIMSEKDIHLINSKEIEINIQDR